MAHKRVNKEDKDEIQFEAYMRLVEGVVLHVLDSIAISEKWINKDISMETLLLKKSKIKEMREWLKGWQWETWLNIYAQHKKIGMSLIHRKFIRILNKSNKYVNERIKIKKASLPNKDSKSVRQVGNTRKVGRPKTKKKD